MKHQLLKTALVSNAAFSTISGLALIIMNGQFQQWFEMDFPFWVVGIGLLPFAYMAYQASQDEQNMIKKGREITILDLVWVVTSIIVLLLVDFTTIGQWLIIGVALIVGDFALFQWLGMRRITSQ
jgi:hypothetical protein